MSNQELSGNEENNVDILELLLQIWKDKFYILTILAVFFMFSIWLLQNSTFKYDISLKVTPSKQINSSQHGQSLGGLASIIGFSTSNNTINSADDYALYKILLKSRIMSNTLSKDKEFITNYSKAEKINISKSLLNSGSITTIDKSWRSKIKNILGLPTHKRTLTLEDLIYKKIISEISISTDKLTNISTISIKSVDPNYGIKLLKKIHNIADFSLKERSLKRTDEYISFLNQQLSKTTKQDQRLSLISNLAEQQRTKMIASSDLSFAADLFGNPFQSVSPTTPRIRNIVLVYLVSGFFLGLFFSILKYFFKAIKN
jgi:uncharacterized protein involved in exopolysaccharide biosynthesis